MDQQTVRKSFKEKLRPTPAQARALDEVLWRCRDLYNTALEQRITAYQRRHVSVSRFEQEAELKAIRAEFPDYEAIHSHILQDVLARLDKTYQAFFRRVQRGEKAGFPRFKGRDRFHSFTFKEYGNGATLDNGFLALSKIGRITVHWSRPLEGIPKTVTISREADGWYVRHFVRRRSNASLAANRTGDRDRPWARGVRHTGRWHAHPHARLLPQDGTLSCQMPAPRRAPQEREPPQAQSGESAGQSASDSATPAHGLSSQDRARACASIRHHLSRRPAGRQYGEKPPPCQVHCRRGVERVSHYPHFQGCKRREASGCGQSCVHQPGVFGPGLWRIVQKGLSVRWHSCPECGVSLHRDHNAALNILRLGQEQSRPGYGLQAST